MASRGRLHCFQREICKFSFDLWPQPSGFLRSLCFSRQLQVFFNKVWRLFGKRWSHSEESRPNSRFEGGSILWLTCLLSVLWLSVRSSQDILPSWSLLAPHKQDGHIPDARLEASNLWRLLMFTHLDIPSSNSGVHLREPQKKRTVRISDYHPLHLFFRPFKLFLIKSKLVFLYTFNAALVEVLKWCYSSQRRHSVGVKLERHELNSCSRLLPAQHTWKCQQARCIVGNVGLDTEEELQILTWSLWFCGFSNWAQHISLVE